MRSGQRRILLGGDIAAQGLHGMDVVGLSGDGDDSATIEGVYAGKDRTHGLALRRGPSGGRWCL